MIQLFKLFSHTKISIGCVWDFLQEFGIAGDTDTEKKSHRAV
jgi:hypothetical protein